MSAAQGSTPATRLLPKHSASRPPPSKLFSGCLLVKIKKSNLFFWQRHLPKVSRLHTSHALPTPGLPQSKLQRYRGSETHLSACLLQTNTISDHHYLSAQCAFDPYTTLRHPAFSIGNRHLTHFCFRVLLGSSIHAWGLFSFWGPCPTLLEV